MKVYLAGPMRGRPDYNFPTFAAMTRRLRVKGYDVWSPHELELRNGFDPSSDEAKPLRDYMKDDIPALLECDTVALLDGWEESKGSQLEVIVAKYCDIPVVRVKHLLEVG